MTAESKSKAHKNKLKSGLQYHKSDYHLKRSSKPDVYIIQSNAESGLPVQVMAVVFFSQLN